MSRPDFILIDGRPYSWRQLCDRRKTQLEAWKAGQGRQLALFELKHDCRPASERTASGRYLEPGLLDLMKQGEG
jgi:hypothetical protein